MALLSNGQPPAIGGLLVHLDIQGKLQGFYQLLSFIFHCFMKMTPHNLTTFVVGKDNFFFTFESTINIL